jgi:hypothetical protein
MWKDCRQLGDFVPINSVLQQPQIFAMLYNYILLLQVWGPLMVAQWLRYYATNRKVAGSIPDGVMDIFH